MQSSATVLSTMSREKKKKKRIYHPDITELFIQGRDRIESSKESEPVSSTSGMSESAACPLSPIA